MTLLWVSYTSRLQNKLLWCLQSYYSFSFFSLIPPTLTLSKEEVCVPSLVHWRSSSSVSCRSRELMEGKRSFLSAWAGCFLCWYGWPQIALYGVLHSERKARCLGCSQWGPILSSQRLVCIRSANSRMCEKGLGLYALPTEAQVPCWLLALCSLPGTC